MTKHCLNFVYLYILLLVSSLFEKGRGAPYLVKIIRIDINVMNNQLGTTISHQTCARVAKENIEKTNFK
jgi:hypothetical protein